MEGLPEISYLSLLEERAERARRIFDSQEVEAVLVEARRMRSLYESESAEHYSYTSLMVLCEGFLGGIHALEQAHLEGIEGVI